MTRNQQFLVIVCALLLAESGEASANVIETTTTAITDQTVGKSGGGSFTLTFSTPISNATELVSISGGTVADQESGDFLLDVKYAGGSTQQIADVPVSLGPMPLQLNTIANVSFNQGTITGLVFDETTAEPFDFYFLNIPVGTQFTFATAASAVPEPASLTLFGSALAFLAAAWRRRARRGSSTA